MRFLALMMVTAAAVGCAGDETPSETMGDGSGDTTASMTTMAMTTMSTTDDASGSADQGSDSDTSADSTGPATSTDTGMSDATETGMETTAATDSGATDSGSTDSGSGTDTGSEESTAGTGMTCPPGDGDAIGLDCDGDSDCPECYTCQGFSGIVFDQACQILCDPEDAGTCPAGYTCTEIEDKGMMPWHQCV